MLSVFRGKQRSAHEYIYWNWSTNRAVRKGDWKLVWDKHAKTWELCDLSKDRTEAHDLAAANSELVAKLTQKWMDWAKMTGVKLNK